MLLASVQAQTQLEKETYPDYDAGFTKWGMTWESMKVHTEDGYTTTMFHVTGNADGPIEITKNAVILQHGMGGAGSGWLTAINKKKPMYA